MNGSPRSTDSAYCFSYKDKSLSASAIISRRDINRNATPSSPTSFRNSAIPEATRSCRHSICSSFIVCSLVHQKPPYLDKGYGSENSPLTIFNHLQESLVL